MAEPRESSGLHSLASLREHEKRHAQQQTDAARSRAEAEQRARQEAARNEQERRLAQRAALEQAESAQRAQLAQLETAQRVEFDRAEALLRTSAELKAQLEREREARRGLELGLTSQLLRQRLWATVSAALCVGGGLAAAGLYFGALRPSADRAVAAARESLLTEQQARTEAQQREARSLRRAAELSSRLVSLEETLRSERELRPSAPVGSGPGRKWKTREPFVVPPVVEPCRDDGDPLNPCLKR
ncbi:MAG TPA: hypothetical protein VJV79_18500 [Polyangiaceae bacterium]|nr:hypothetical protein [Polyangiaceae bacterium]